MKDQERRTAAKTLRQHFDLSHAAIAEVVGMAEEEYRKCDDGGQEFPIHVLETLSDLYDKEIDTLLNPHLECKSEKSGFSAHPGTSAEELRKTIEFNRITRQYNPMLLIKHRGTPKRQTVNTY